MTTEEISKMFAEINKEGYPIREKTIEVDFPKPKGILKINNNISFQLYDKKLPCRFHRWMARILLGWKYEVYKDE